MRAATFVRFILSALLLVQAFRSAGWAVGLLLLLLVANAEAQRELCRRRYERPARR